MGRTRFSRGFRPDLLIAWPVLHRGSSALSVAPLNKPMHPLSFLAAPMPRSHAVSRTDRGSTPDAGEPARSDLTKRQSLGH